MPVFFLCSACLAFARATDDDVCPNGQYRLSRRRRYDWNSRPEDDSDEARSAARDSVTAAIRNASVLEIGGPTVGDRAEPCAARPTWCGDGMEERRHMLAPADWWTTAEGHQSRLEERLRHAQMMQD